MSSARRSSRRRCGDWRRRGTRSRSWSGGEAGRGQARSSSSIRRAVPASSAPRREPLPLDGPQQELVELLVLGRAQERLPLLGVGEVPRDQPSLRVGQGVGQADPRVSLTGDPFCLGDELLCAVLVHLRHLRLWAPSLAHLTDRLFPPRAAARRSTWPAGPTAAPTGGRHPARWTLCSGTATSYTTTTS